MNAAVVALVVLVGSSSVAHAALSNSNTAWLAVAQSIVRAEAEPNQVAARVYALVSLAQFKALKAKPPGFSSDQALTDVAAHAVLSALYPWRQSQTLDGIIRQQLISLTTAEKNVARSVGSRAAWSVLNGRIGDATTQWKDYQPQAAAPYKYQYTPATAASNVPAQTYALYPQLANGKPLVANDAYLKSIQPLYKIDFESARYQAELNQSYYYGNLSSPVRSAYEAETARFWADLGGTQQVSGHWNNISWVVLPSTLSLYDSSLFFARLNAAIWDASVLAWRVKYGVQHWRPVTAFRAGAPGFLPVDPNWTPFLATPPHPEYPSGHQAVSGAALGILLKTLGTDAVNFSISSEWNLNVTRSYTSLRTAADEVGYSRVVGGIHFLQAGTDGLDLGEKVAANVYSRIS